MSFTLTAGTLKKNTIWYATKDSLYAHKKKKKHSVLRQPGIGYKLLSTPGLGGIVAKLPNTESHQMTFGEFTKYLAENQEHRYKIIGFLHNQGGGSRPCGEDSIDEFLNWCKIAGWAYHQAPAVGNLVDGGKISWEEAKEIYEQVPWRTASPTQKKTQKKTSGGGNPRTKKKRNLDLILEEGAIIEHTYKGHTAQAEYSGKNQVTWEGSEPVGLSGFAKLHVEWLLEEGMIEKGCLSWNGWDVCNLPHKCKGEWEGAEEE